MAKTSDKIGGGETGKKMRTLGVKKLLPKRIQDQIQQNQLTSAQRAASLGVNGHNYPSSSPTYLPIKRAKIIKKAADKVLEKMGIQDPILDIAKKLEEAALSDDYFVEKKLYPNVDFYSGIIYRALGIPTKMFTVMFALGRLPGWQR